jgi:hypothetical protein
VITDQLTRFAEAMARNPELKQEWLALAARYGVDLSGGQMSDDELGKVAGGVDANTAVSNTSKKLDSTASALVRNIAG